MRECVILKKEGASHDVKSGRRRVRRVNVIMTLILSQIVWTRLLTIVFMNVVIKMNLYISLKYHSNSSMKLTIII